jgi:myosin-crossreactive antigen
MIGILPQTDSTLNMIQRESGVWQLWENVVTKGNDHAPPNFFVQHLARYMLVKEAWEVV